MRVLYKRTSEPVPLDFVPSEVQKDILDHWTPNYNLFTISQISDRTGFKRGQVQRKARQLIKMGLIERHSKRV